MSGKGIMKNRAQRAMTFSTPTSGRDITPVARRPGRAKVQTPILLRVGYVTPAGSIFQMPTIPHFVIHGYNDVVQVIHQPPCAATI